MVGPCSAGSERCCWRGETAQQQPTPTPLEPCDLGDHSCELCEPLGVRLTMASTFVLFGTVTHKPRVSACMCLQVFHLPQLDANLLQCHIWDGCQVIVLSVLPTLDSE